MRDFLSVFLGLWGWLILYLTFWFTLFNDFYFAVNTNLHGEFWFEFILIHLILFFYFYLMIRQFIKLYRFMMTQVNIEKLLKYLEYPATIRDMTCKFPNSRTAIRRALNDLIRDGLVVRWSIGKLNATWYRRVKDDNIYN